jgi:hypothetical protein
VDYSSHFPEKIGKSFVGITGTSRAALIVSQDIRIRSDCFSSGARISAESDLGRFLDLMEKKSLILKEGESIDRVYEPGFSRGDMVYARSWLTGDYLTCLGWAFEDVYGYEGRFKFSYLIAERIPYFKQPCRKALLRVFLGGCLGYRKELERFANLPDDSGEIIGTKVENKKKLMEKIHFSRIIRIILFYLQDLFRESGIGWKTVDPEYFKDFVSEGLEKGLIDERLWNLIKAIDRIEYGPERPITSRFNRLVENGNNKKK